MREPSHKEDIVVIERFNISNKYISLGISPDADAIVLQRINPDADLPAGFTGFAFTISLAELDSFGRADATGKIGRLTLSAMRVEDPVISEFADALISPISGRPFAVEVPDHSGSKRGCHLRVKCVAFGEKSVLIERFHHDDAAGGDPAPLLLDTLIALGPQRATDRVGAALLDELAALHPEVFARFSGLAETTV